MWHNAIGIYFNMLTDEHYLSTTSSIYATYNKQYSTLIISQAKIDTTTYSFNILSLPPLATLSPSGLQSRAYT